MGTGPRSLGSRLVPGSRLSEPGLSRSDRSHLPGIPPFPPRSTEFSERGRWAVISSGASESISGSHWISSWMPAPSACAASSCRMGLPTRRPDGRFALTTRGSMCRSTSPSRLEHPMRTDDRGGMRVCIQLKPDASASRASSGRFLMRRFGYMPPMEVSCRT